MPNAKRKPRKTHSLNLISKVTVCSPQLKVLTIVVESFKSCNQGASNYPLAVHFVDK